MEFDWWVYISCQLAALLVSVLSYKKASVDVSGMLAMILISGSFIWLDHLDYLLVIFTMYATSTLLTKLHPHKKNFEKVVARTGPRNAIQAVANLGFAWLMMMIHYTADLTHFIVGFIASVAAANADSWSSEIGGLSSANPRLMTTGEQVDKGVSGGVSLLGTFGGVLGSLAIALVAYLVMDIHLTTALIAFGAGIFGFLLDSFIGAKWQALYKNPIGQLSEIPGHGRIVKGYRWLDNDAVNLICSVSAGLLGLAIGFALRY